MAVTTLPSVLVCNPDIEVRPGALGALAGALAADPGCALVGPLIRDPAGARYPSARSFPSMVDAAGHAAFGLFAPDNRFTRSYQNAHLGAPGATSEPVDWVSGACFLVRRSAFEEVGGFDEAYFMYAEDVDLCWRLGRAGWGVAYAPAAEVTHSQGVSTDRHPYRMIVEHHRSLLRFAARSSEGWRRLLLPLVALGTGARCGLACAQRAAQGRRRASGVSGPQVVGCRPIMASNSTGKWVERAATTGGGRTYRGQMPVNWYASLALICIVGLLLIGFSRYENTHRTASSAGPPTTQQQWHAALGIDICGTIQPNLPASTNTTKTGLTANGNGVLTIAPKNSSESGANATLGKFVSGYKGLQLTANTIQYPGKPVYTDGDVCPKGTPDQSKPGVVIVVQLAQLRLERQGYRDERRSPGSQVRQRAADHHGLRAGQRLDPQAPGQDHHRADHLGAVDHTHHGGHPVDHGDDHDRPRR